MMSRQFGESHDEHQAFLEHKFEEQSVTRVLKRYRLLKSAKWDLLLAHERKSGRKRLKFAEFHDRFPSFPVLLDARRLTQVSRSTSVPDLFKKFDCLPLWDAFVETRESYSGWPEDQPVGLIFSWPYCGPLVIHNARLERKTPGLRIGWQGADGEAVIIQKFDSLLKDIDLAVGGRWNPDPGYASE